MLARIYRQGNNRKLLKWLKWYAESNGHSWRAVKYTPNQSVRRQWLAKAIIGIIHRDESRDDISS